MATFDSAVRWEVADQIQLFLSPFSGTSTSANVVVSANGEIVGGSAFEIEWSVAFVWDSTNGFDGFSVDSGYNNVRGISADGAVLAVSSSDTFGGNYAWIGSPDSGFTNVGTLSGPLGFASAGGLSSDGLVLVGSSSSSQGTQAFRWDAVQGMVGLGFLPGDDRSSASDANVDGSVIVGTSGVGADSQAFAWTATTGMIPLGILPGTPGTLGSAARAVSDDGGVIVGVSGAIAFVWTPTTNMVTLADYLASLGADCLAGWELQDANDVSDDGNAVAGTLMNPSGQMEAFVAYFEAPNDLPIGSRACSPATANTTGFPATLDVLGYSCIADNQVELQVNDAPAGVWGLFLAAPVSNSMPNPLGGVGTLCLGGPIIRLGGQGFPTDAFGRASRVVNLPSLPVTAGSTWFFQAIYRDSNPSSNFSDSVAVSFR
jgi:uncharacterized membrane protein